MRPPNTPEETNAGIRAQKGAQVNVICLNNICSCNLISQSVFPENDIHGDSLEKHTFYGQVSLGSIDFKKFILYPQRAIEDAMLPKHVFFSLCIKKKL